MIKVISKSNLIQHLTVTKLNGEEAVACLMPKSSVMTKDITPSLQYLIDNNQVTVISGIDSIAKESNKDSGSFEESAVITKSEVVEKSQEETTVDPDTTNEETKSNRGRKKKTDSGDSDDNQ